MWRNILLGVIAALALCANLALAHEEGLGSHVGKKHSMAAEFILKFQLLEQERELAVICSREDRKTLVRFILESALETAEEVGRCNDLCQSLIHAGEHEYDKACKSLVGPD